MKIGPGVSELWGVENRPLPLTRPMAYTTACTTVQAVIIITSTFVLREIENPQTEIRPCYCVPLPTQGDLGL